MSKHPPNSGEEDKDLRNFLDLLPAVALVEKVDHGRFVAVNERAVDLFRMPRDRLLSNSFTSLSAPAESLEGQDRATLRGQIEATIAGHPFVGRWICRNAVGSEIPCELRLFRMPGHHNQVCGVVIELGESEGIRERLRRAREQLREATNARHESIEAERARLSRELHDQLGQLMTAAKINIAMIVRSIHKLSSRHRLRQELLERTTIATDVVDQMLDRARNMAAELRPPGLDDLGLQAVIESKLSAFALRTGILAGSNLDPESVSLPRKVSAVLLRCMEELLTNVARHAQATCVEVRLLYRNGLVMLEVCDDGVGMHEAARNGALGIVGLKERVSELEGTLRFESASMQSDSTGTTAIVEIPITQSTL